MIEIKMSFKIPRFLYQFKPHWHTSICNPDHFSLFQTTHSRSWDSVQASHIIWPEEKSSAYRYSKMETFWCWNKMENLWEMHPCPSRIAKRRIHGWWSMAWHYHKTVIQLGNLILVNRVAELCLLYENRTFNPIWSTLRFKCHGVQSCRPLYIDSEIVSLRARP